MSEYPPPSDRGLPPDEVGAPSSRDGGYPASFHRRYKEHGSEPAEMSLLDLLGMLRRRWVVVLGFTAVCVGVAAYKALTSAPPPAYRATAVIRVQDTQRTLTGVPDWTQPNVGGGVDAILSLLEVMRSEVVLGDAVDRSVVRLRQGDTGAPPTYLGDVEIASDVGSGTLHFRFSDDDFTVAYGADEASGTYGDPVELPGIRFTVAARPPLSEADVRVLSRGSVLSSLRSTLTAARRPGTDVLDVRFTAGDPVLARVVINEVVDAFRRNSIAMSRDQSRRRRIFLEEQLRQAREAQEEAQLALSRFRSREQVFSSQARLSAEQAGLMGIDTRREELLAERRFYDSVLGELERPGSERRRGIVTLAASGELRSNPVISSLLQQLIRYESAREELITGEGGLRPDHPDVLREDALIASTQERLLDAVRSHLEALDSRVAELNRAEDRSAQRMRRLPDAEAEESRLVQRVAGAVNLTGSLEADLQRARIAEAVEGGQVEILERARGASPVDPGSRTVLIILIGLMAGLILGGGVGLALEHVNTSIKHEGELEQLLKVPGLAVIPRIAPEAGVRRRLTRLPGIRTLEARLRRAHARNGAAGAARNGPSGAANSASAGAEAYRTLRTNLIFSPTVETLKTAVITSAAPQEGKTTTAANLAVAFAQYGLSVLLVDADLRRPRQHDLFNVPESPGLVDVLLGEAASGDAIHRTPFKRLWVLPAGTRSSNPGDLLGGRRMRQLLEALGERFDIILLDTPPLLAVADAANLSVHADGAIVVVHAGRTDREAVQAAVQKLGAVGARVIGAVLNDRDAKVPQYSRYQRYSYGYEYDPV